MDRRHKGIIIDERRHGPENNQRPVKKRRLNVRSDVCPATLERTESIIGLKTNIVAFVYLVFRAMVEFIFELICYVRATRPDFQGSDWIPGTIASTTSVPWNRPGFR